MESFELEMYEGYPLVHLKEGTYLVDTGCPDIVGMDPSVKYVMIDGKKISTPFVVSYSDEAMKISFGKRIQGIIGLHTLKSFGVVTFDKTAHKIIFGDETKHNDNSFSTTGNFLFPCSINGNKDNGFLDTGAHAVMINDRNDVRGCRNLGTCREVIYNGSICSMEMYEVKFAFNNKEIMTKAILIPENLKGCYPYRYFFNMDIISSEYYSFDFNKNVISYR